MKQFYFKMIKIPTVTAFFGILFLLASQVMQAATFTSTGTGAWNDPATWGLTGTATAGTTFPGSSDTVIIKTGHVVTFTMTAASTVAVLTIEQGGTLNVNSTGAALAFTITSSPSGISGLLNCGANVNLSVSSDFTVNSTGSVLVDATNGKTISLPSSSGKTLTNYGTITTSTLSIGSNPLSTVNNYGTLTTTGFSSSNQGTFNNYATGVFNYAGGTIPGLVTINASTIGNTVNYSLTNNQFIKDTNYYNLNILTGGGTASNSNKIWYQAEDRTVLGNLTISNGAIFKVTSASVSSVTIGSQGTYLAAPTVTFSAAPTGGNSATGTVLTSGISPNIFVTGVAINNPGSGYTSAPTITFSSGTATATANLYNSPSTYKLTVVGTTTNNGTISVDAIAGTGDKTFSTFTNTGTFTLPVGNLVISNALTTSGSLTLSGSSSLTVAPAATLTVAGGTTNFGGRPVTFKSDATGTARFGTLTGTLSNDANVTVERFIPAKRAFRLLSSPVTTTTSISANWQLGTHITGAGGNSNGFDATATDAPSLFTHDNANQAWVAVANTSTNVLTAGVPYRIMVRGDRTTLLNDNAASASNTILRAKGTLKTGTVAVAGLSTAADGFSLIGNPYQSTVDMAATLTGATNLKNSYFVWDPTLGTRGAYVTRDLSGSGTNNITSNVDNYLQPGQACFVQTLSAPTANPTLSFTEAYKSTTTATNLGVMRAVAPISGTGTSASPSASIRLTLFNKTAMANQGTPSDGAVVLFNAASANEVDANDCSKMTNLDENLAFNTKGKLLSIEHRAVPTAADEIQLAITQYRAKDYTLVAQGTNLEGVTAYLVDQYTKTTTALPASGSINYNFTVDPSNANSIAANRFKIIFQDATSTTEFTEKEVKVYPNPSTGGMVTISLPYIQEESKVSILNFAGETVYSTTIAAGENAAINPNKSLAVGIYFVKMEQAGKTVTKKLIIK